MPEWLKDILRPIHFFIFRLRGYPGVEFHRSRIVAIDREYDDVYSYRIEKPPELAYAAGQYTHLVAPRGHINEKDVQHMSFASAPAEAELRFTMDLQSDSLYKRKFRGARAGDEVGFYTIRGAFTLEGVGKTDRLLFIAGGIGITAIRSLIASNPAQPWQLVYAGKGYCYPGFWRSAEAEGKVKFVKRHDLFEQIDRALPSADQFYICGTEGFVSAVSGHLQSRDVGSDRIRTENFSE
ncbi:MAG: FAD-dependent oxidoreductase [Pseudomonadota bacterium]